MALRNVLDHSLFNIDHDRLFRHQQDPYCVSVESIGYTVENYPEPSIDACRQLISSVLCDSSEPLTSIEVHGRGIKYGLVFNHPETATNFKLTNTCPLDSLLVMCIEGMWSWLSTPDQRDLLSKPPESLSWIERFTLRLLYFAVGQEWDQLRLYFLRAFNVHMHRSKGLWYTPFELVKHSFLNREDNHLFFKLTWHHESVMMPSVWYFSFTHVKHIIRILMTDL
jgi:hypothetical protein